MVFTVYVSHCTSLLVNALATTKTTCTCACTCAMVAGECTGHDEDDMHMRMHMMVAGECTGHDEEGCGLYRACLRPNTNRDAG